MRLLFLILLLPFTQTLFCQSFSSLKIDLITEGADVFIDKVQIKKTNLANTLTVASGKHIITAFKNGYLPYEDSFSISNGEKRTISISLVNDTRSSISIITNSSKTKLKIDGKEQDWNATTAFHIILVPGKYQLNFNEYGKIEVTRDISISPNSEYSINVNLAEELPKVTPQEIGRNFKQLDPSTFTTKQETKIEINNNRKYITTIPLTIVGMKIGSKNSSAGGLALGAFIGGLIGWIIMPAKSTTVADNENIQYNLEQNRKKKDLENEISLYNTETSRLILQRQKEKYIEYAVIITKR